MLHGVTQYNNTFNFKLTLSTKELCCSDVTKFHDLFFSIGFNTKWASLKKLRNWFVAAISEHHGHKEMWIHKDGGVIEDKKSD